MNPIVCPNGCFVDSDAIVHLCRAHVKNRYLKCKIKVHVVRAREHKLPVKKCRWCGTKPLGEIKNGYHSVCLEQKLNSKKGYR